MDRLSGSAVEEIRVSSEGAEIHITFAADGSADLRPPLDHMATSPDALEVTAPMPGLVYRSPAPDQPPFVTPGQYVEAGQTLVLIEAMKSMLPVTAPISGTVDSIPAEDQTTCDMGAVLVVLRGPSA